MEPLPPAAFPAPVSTSVLGPNTGVPVKEGGERGSICLTTFSGHILDVSSVAVSHDGQWLVSGSDDKNVLFWDVRSAQAHFALHGYKGWTVSVDMSPTGYLFATGGNDGIGYISFLITHSPVLSILTMHLREIIQTYRSRCTCAKLRDQSSSTVPVRHICILHDYRFTSQADHDVDRCLPLVYQHEFFW